MAITEIQVPLSEDDVVYRQRMTARARDDHSDVFKSVNVTVESSVGGKSLKHTIALKMPVNSPYAFAVYAENPAFHDSSYDAWRAAASDALQKHCAMKGAQIKLGPTTEAANRYNFMVETQAPLVRDERAA